MSTTVEEKTTAKAEKAVKVQPRLKERYRSQIAKALQGGVLLQQHHADPGAGEDRREHGRR